jgi:hypothetical protein
VLVRRTADGGTYTVDLALHDNLDDIPAGDRPAGYTSGNLSLKTVTDGVADAEDVVLTAVPASGAAGAIVIYKDTGTASSSRLIAYIDTATGLPITPNGSNVTITWDSGTNRIFKL